jgi:hypothetical protein
MSGRIPMGMFQQGTYLPTSCAFSIELTRQAPELCIDCATITKRYRYVIVAAELHVKMLTMNPSILATHNSEFITKKAQYRLQDERVKTALVPAGEYSFRSEVINGKLPSAIVLGLASQKSVNGSLDTSPFNFKNFGLTKVTLSFDNRPGLTQTIELDFANNNYLLGFQSLFKARGRRNGGNGISRAEYVQGNVLFMFDLQEAVGSEFHFANSGKIFVSLDFKTATPEPIALVVFSVYERLLELDQYRNVYLRA